MTAFMQDAAALIELLEQWVARGWLRDLDLAWVRFLHEEVPSAGAPVLLAAALVSHQLGRGHVCLDLQATVRDAAATLALPPERGQLDGLPALALPSDLLQGWTLSSWLDHVQHADLVDDGRGSSPLVLSGHRLYLRRYWGYERQVEQALQEKMALSDTPAAPCPAELVRETLQTLFPPRAGQPLDWQKMACALAARSAFSIITGGPGTGKTTTVVRLLALLQHVALTSAQGRPLTIRLAAPTGKAAARLRESIAHALHHLPPLGPDHRVHEHIPQDVTTLHRLLGTRPDSRRFRHDAHHPLALGVLVIDEASMVDLEMMAAVLQALPPRARLILLGDQDQLASVEAGSVLGELCRRARGGHYQPAVASWLQSMTGQAVPDALQDPHGMTLDQHIAMLRHSHRFDQSSGIGRLAAAVNAGDLRGIQRVFSEGHADLIEHALPDLNDPRFDGVVLGRLDSSDGPQGLARYLHIMHAQRPALEAPPAEWDAWALQVLAAHGRFQLLCALRHGPCGVSGLNSRIEALLQRHRLIEPDHPWYAGRPVLITRNDYALGLMNGDVGITLPCPHRDPTRGELAWTLRVAFAAHENARPIRWVLPSRLTAVDTVYALTVHKSQGSEFEHCAVLLPPERSSVLTRELIYTGITRARRWFSVLTTGHPHLLQEAVRHTVQRSGGLFDQDSPG